MPSQSAASKIYIIKHMITRPSSHKVNNIYGWTKKIIIMLSQNTLYNAVILMLMALRSLLLAVHATFHTSFGSELQFISEVKVVHSWQEPNLFIFWLKG